MKITKTGLMNGARRVADWRIIALIVASVSLGIAAPDVLTYLFKAALVIVTLFLPGFVIADQVGSFDNDERIAFSGVFSVIILLVLSVIALEMQSYRNEFVAYSITIVMFVAGYFFVKRRLYRNVMQSSMPFEYVAFLYFFCILFVALPMRVGDQPTTMPFTYTRNLIQVPFLGSDPYIYYRQAQFFLYHLNPSTENFWGNWQLADRTPIMGILHSFFFLLFNVDVPKGMWAWQPNDGVMVSLQMNDPTGIWIFRIVGIACNGLVILPAYLLTSKMFSEKVGRLLLLFYSINAFVIWSVYYGRPVPFSLYFTSLFLYLIIRNERGACAIKTGMREYLFSGFLLGLAYLVHPGVLVYLPGAVYYVLTTRIATTHLTTRFRSFLGYAMSYVVKIKWLLVVATSFFLTITPWVVWSKVYANELVNAPFWLMPFDITAILVRSNVHSWDTVQEVFTVFRQTPLSEVLLVRVVNLSRTILNLDYIMHLSLSRIYPWLDSTITQMSPKWLFSHMHIYTLTGALTFALSIFCYSGLVNQLFTQSRKIMITFVILPMAMVALLVGYPDYSLVLYSTDLMLIILLAVGVCTIMNHRRTLVAIWWLAFIEQIIIVWLTFYNVESSYHNWIFNDYFIVGLILLGYAIIMFKARRELL